MQLFETKELDGKVATKSVGPSALLGKVMCGILLVGIGHAQMKRGPDEPFALTEFVESFQNPNPDDVWFSDAPESPAQPPEIADGQDQFN